MVCSLAGGHMTTTSHIMSDNVGSWKLAAQYIQRELKEADELNLLDEEDMHVFGLRPMMDPLILVRCNSCKRPVKNSQYATHAEICKSLDSLVDSTKETDVVAVQKKPPRKERKKLQYNTTKVAPVGKPQRCNASAASKFHAKEQSLKETSFPTQAKGRQFQNKTRERSVKNFDNVTSHQNPTKLDNVQNDGRKRMLNDPAPLATKIYYSQRNQRLRSAIRNMYYRTSYKQQLDDDGLTNIQFSDSYNNIMPSTNGNFHYNQIDDQLEKIGQNVPYMVENTDTIPSKSSEADSDEFRKFLNFPDQFIVNNEVGPKTTIESLASDILPADEN
ncbi:uncharacterized protein [Rutidosis leptorrhynchoides]|uniref:uncharacterized protein n=1 Tax=Rutidosis leptorrhynchoides TaxID=125765 RepID=UPI003A9998FF